MEQEKTTIPNGKLTASREHELLKIAFQLFVKRGFGNTSIEQLAKTAGMSKATIYRRYPNKGALFEAVVLAGSANQQKIFEHLELDEDHPAQCLRQVAYLMRELTTKNLELIRLIISEAKRNPELGRRCRSIIANPLHHKLATYFDRLIALGKMRPCDTEYAANFCLLTLSRGMRPLFSAIMSEEEEEQRLNWDIETLCRGFSIPLQSEA